MKRKLSKPINEDAIDRNLRYDDIDTEPYMTDAYNKYPLNMKNGGALYHLAGGGPLFMAPQFGGPTKLDVGRMEKPQGETASSGKKSSSSETGMKAVMGDIQMSINRLNEAEKIYADKLWSVYGGNHELAQQDPYFKQALAKATLTPDEIALRERRLKLTDNTVSYINDKANPKGSAIDLTESRRNRDANGQIGQLYSVAETFNNYENTAMENLYDKNGKSVVGATWDNPNKLVGTVSQLSKDLRDRFKEASGMIKGVKDVRTFMRALASQTGNKAFEERVTRTITEKTNKDALNEIVTQLGVDLTEEQNDAIEQMYIKNHYDPNTGKYNDVYDGEGKLRKDYIEFKDSYLKSYILDFLQSDPDYKEDTASGRWYDTFGAGSTQEKEKIGPLENIAFNMGVGFKMGTGNKTLAIPNADGTYTKFDANVGTYPVTDEPLNSYAEHLGDKASSLTGNGVVLTAAGVPIKLPSDLQLGALVSVPTNFVVLPKTELTKTKGRGVTGTYRDSWTIDGSGNILKADGSYFQQNEMQGYAVVEVAFTADDLKNHPELGDLVSLKGAGTMNKMVWKPYHKDNTESKSGILDFGNIIAEGHTSIRDVGDYNLPFMEDIKDLEIPVIGTQQKTTLGDKYSGIKWDDIYVATYMIPVNSALGLEESKKGSDYGETFPQQRNILETAQSSKIK